MTTVLESALAQWRSPVMRGRAEFPATWAGDRAVTVAAGSTTATAGRAGRECHHHAPPAAATATVATRAHLSPGEKLVRDPSSATGEGFWRLAPTGTAGATSCSRVPKE